MFFGEEYKQSGLQWSFQKLTSDFYESIQEIDSSTNTYFDNLKTTKKRKKFCSIARDFASKNGISSSREHLLKRNIKFAYTEKISGLFEKTLISINLSDASIWESTLGKTEKGKKYNCSTIDLEVPEIKEAENSILDETT